MSSGDRDFVPDRAVSHMTNLLRPLWPDDSAIFFTYLLTETGGVLRRL